MDGGVMCDRRTTESEKGSIVNVNIKILSNFFQKSFSPVFYPMPFAFDKKMAKPIIVLSLTNQINQ